MQIPDYFKFYNKTRIISGKKALENIPYELKSMDAVKPLIITDKRSVKDGIVKNIVSAYGDSGLVIGAVFDQAADYVSTNTVIDAAKLFRARGCDSIIAIGGMNSASLAKGLNLLVSNKSDDLLQFETLPDTMELYPSIMVVSSDSTGRETSNKAVIDGRVYLSSELMPDIAIIDSRMLKKREMSFIASSAICALADAVEACSADLANPMNDAFAFASIELICENLTAVFNKGYSGKRKLGLANGIAISGIVSSNAPEGFGGRLSLELSKSTGHSRELCSSILLPYILDYKLRKIKNGVRSELLLPVVGIDKYCSSPESERSSLGVYAVAELVKKAGKYIPVSLKELKIPLYVITNIAESLEKEYAVNFGKGGVLKILESAYDGSLLSGGNKE